MSSDAGADCLDFASPVVGVVVMGFVSIAVGLTFATMWLTGFEKVLST